MDVTYTIVKVYVTERNKVIKCHSNVITIWRMSAMEVTALSKNLRSEMKDVQEKESIMGVRGSRKIRPLRLQSGITRQASWSQTVVLGIGSSISSVKHLGEAVWQTMREIQYNTFVSMPLWSVSLSDCTIKPLMQFCSMPLQQVVQGHNWRVR